MLDNGLVPPRHAGRSPVVTEDTFEVLAREWFVKQEKKWAAKHRATVLARLENYTFPKIGSEAIVDITPPMLLALNDLEKAGILETARRVRQIVGQVFRYVVSRFRSMASTLLNELWLFPDSG